MSFHCAPAHSSPPPHEYWGGGGCPALGPGGRVVHGSLFSVHSRIEWVWLHWSEYLLARDEFYRWFQKMMVVLELPVELQLGLKEKQWQLSHAQVLLHNVGNQAVLLDRLLEEAASLFNRIGDPSVDEDAQKRMKAEYAAVKAKAQVREAWGALSSPARPLAASVSPCIHYPPLSTHAARERPLAPHSERRLVFHLFGFGFCPRARAETRTSCLDCA